jgi:hypothetical protein
VVALLVAILAAFFWPGVAMYDTVSQYDQVLSDEVTDWHPPIMVRLWQLLHPLAPGTAPMFVVQAALYGLGFGLIVAALIRINRPWAGVAAAILALSPLLLGWQMVVLKDTQMQGALLAAFGIIAFARLSGRPLPAALVVVAAILLVYATLLRTNAAFVTVPLGLTLLQRPLAIGLRAATAVGLIAAVLVLSPTVNDWLFGASRSGVARSLPLFDLAAIAVATPDTPSPFTPRERAQIVGRHCVKAFFWDPLGDPSACAPATARLNDEPVRALYLALAREAATHPLAYAEHRFRHWNSTERWLVSPGLTDAGPPDEAEPNELGLESPRSSVVPAWQSVAAIEAASPLGWPITWTIIGLLLLPQAWRRRGEPAGGLAFALVVSALALEASFLAISIASDLRYHLWPMTAMPLALILLADRRPRRSETVIGASLLVLVIAGGIVGRAILPQAPDSYQGMIHWTYG